MHLFRVWLSEISHQPPQWIIPVIRSIDIDDVGSISQGLPTLSVHSFKEVKRLTLLKDIVVDKEERKRALAWEKMEYDY